MAGQGKDPPSPLADGPHSQPGPAMPAQAARPASTPGRALPGHCPGVAQGPRHRGGVSLWRGGCRPTRSPGARSRPHTRTCEPMTNAARKVRKCGKRSKPLSQLNIFLWSFAETGCGKRGNAETKIRRGTPQFAALACDLRTIRNCSANLALGPPLPGQVQSGQVNTIPPQCNPSSPCQGPACALSLRAQARKAR
jgi:hypothetical protein